MLARAESAPCPQELCPRGSGGRALGRKGVQRVHADSHFPISRTNNSGFRNEGGKISNISTSQTQTRLPFCDRSSWEVGFLLPQQVVRKTHLQCGAPLTALERAPCLLPFSCRDSHQRRIAETNDQFTNTGNSSSASP